MVSSRMNFVKGLLPYQEQDGVLHVQWEEHPSAPFLCLGRQRSSSNSASCCHSTSRFLLLVRRFGLHEATLSK